MFRPSVTSEYALMILSNPYEVGIAFGVALVIAAIAWRYLLKEPR